MKREKHALKAGEKNPHDGGRGYSMTSSSPDHRKEPLYRFVEIDPVNLFLIERNKILAAQSKRADPKKEAIEDFEYLEESEVNDEDLVRYYKTGHEA